MNEYYQKAVEEAVLAEQNFTAKDAELGALPPVERNPISTVTENGGNEQPTVAPFSMPDDAERYNARVFTKSRIDTLVANEFNGRKAAQVAKMQGLTAEVLKIDFNYKIARKIKVYTAKGRCFSPFKCIATIQNEDTQTIWWGGIAGSESMTKLQPALRGIKARCEHLGSTIKG